VYYDHPELEPNMFIDSDEDINQDGRFTDADENGLDDDGNDYVDDVVGWDFGNSDNVPFEPTPWHGTHVAGCATMASNNGAGGASVGWGARILAVKAARDSDPNSIPYGFQAITYATENGATVINLSWGRAGSPSQGEQNVINAAYNAGIVVVAAAGNESSSVRHYPAGYNNVLSVVATDQTDEMASFSNYGTWVDICAPGVGVYSTWDHNSYSALDGTSMASPITSGAVALLRIANPTLSVDEIVDKIKLNADTIDYLNPDYVGMLGAGRVNIAAAIGKELFPLIGYVSQTVVQTEDDGDMRLNPSERFTIYATLSNSWADAHDVTGILRSDGEFTVLDSEAVFGNITGNGGTGNNSSNPFDVRVDADAHPGSHVFTLHVTSSNGVPTDLNLSVSITLEKAGFPGNIPGNIESPPLVIDIDSDSHNEIIVSASDRNYYIFEDNGTQASGWPQTVSHEAPGGAAVGDIDHDGDLDIVGMSRNGNIYAWNANGTLLTGFPVNCGTLMFGTPALGDIDGDSTLEIVAGMFSSKSLYVIKSDGTIYPNWPFIGLGNIFGSAALADIDEDNLPEILYCDFDSTLHVLNANKTEAHGFPVRVIGQVKTSPCVADIDGDGHLNIIVGTSSGRLYAFDNTGGIMPGWPVMAGNSLSSSPSLADIDNDGHLEVIVGCNDQKLYVYDANGQLQNGFPFQAGGIITASPVVGDIDGDSLQDIAFGAYDGYYYAVNYLGQSLRNFPIQASVNGQITGSAALADLDGDGDCDYIGVIKATGNNLDVFDYKVHLPEQIFTWPTYGKNPLRNCYYGYFETGIEDSPSNPVTYSLNQNYPNPFNMSTTISFSLSKTQHIDLNIYDLLGRKIRTLVSGPLVAGGHAVTWNGLDDNGSAAASGIYFYKLAGNDGNFTKRMTLIK